MSGTPRATKRSSRPRAGYCSPTGLRQPAEESSAAMPDDAAASAMRSHHSAGASGTWPATLIRSGWASTSQLPRRRQLLQGRGVGLPAGVDVAGRPLGHRHRVVEVVEAPAADPVHRAQQDVEGVAGQQVGHRVHPVLVVVDLEADDDGQPGLLGLQGALDVGVEVGGGVELPVVGHGLGQRRGHPLVVPEAAQQGVGLAEPEEVLGQRQLGHPDRLRPARSTRPAARRAAASRAPWCGQRWRW